MSASHLAGTPTTSRTPLRVDVDRGRLETGGWRATFGPGGPPDDALIAYLKLVRRLRDVEREPSFVLRRDDVVVLADALREDAVVVLDRLGELMGATVTQRRTMVTAFLAGALLIAVATGATALAPGDGRVPAPSATSGERSEATVSQVERVPDDRDDEAPSAAGTTLDADAATDAGPHVSATAAPDVVEAEAAPDPGVAGGGSPDPEGPASGGASTTVPAPPEPADGVGDRSSTSPVADRVPAEGAPMRWSTGPEIVQPGATIDIPFDDEVDTGEDPEADDEVDVPVTLPVVELPEDAADPSGSVLPPQD